MKDELIDSLGGGKMLSLEGLDASGKSTQMRLLRAWLDAIGVQYDCVSFPRTSSPGFGNAIRQFLNGEFGSVEEVNPYLLAALFAADRLAARPQMAAALSAGKLLVVDRYVHSNIAFQCAKLANEPEKQKLTAWIEEMEFTVGRLPKPELAVYFRVPIDFVRENVATRRGHGAPVASQSVDIHEASDALQLQVAKEYARLAERDNTIQVIECACSDGRMRKADDVFADLKTLVGDRLSIHQEHISCP